LQLPQGEFVPINLPMAYATRFVAITAFVLCPMAQLRAEDKEPFAIIELGAATERSIQDGTYSAGPSASIEFPVVKDWLEIETGISPLFRPGQTEWQADLLFKKPFTINQHIEFMIGVGTDGLNLDPLLIALLKKIPESEKEWPAPQRVRWFKTFAMNVSQIYDADDEPVEMKIELVKEAAN
jgi:hypothetical protein